MVVFRPLVSGDYRARIQRLDCIQGGNPLAARLRIGLGEIRVYAIVGGVTRYDQANGGNMRAGRVVDIGMPERHSD